LLVWATPGDHIQSLILGTALLVGSLLAAALGVVAELMRINRVLIEDGLERTRRLEVAAARGGPFESDAA
jgi:hypothetical protein